MSTKSLPPAAVSDREIDMLYRIMGGHIYFQTLSAAVQFDLFGLLKRRGRLTCDQIALELGIERQPARILLLGCTSLGLVEKSGPSYSNSNLAEQMLVRDAPGNVCAVIDWQHFINYRGMYWFHQALKANGNEGLKEFAGDEATLYERLAHAPELERIFQDAMQAISVQANQLLVEHVDLSDVRHLVDVGGGNGSNIIALAKKNPHLRATVFDSPSVCRIAEDNFRAEGLEGRLDAVPGNCFRDEFPAGADCLLFAHFFTIWSEEKNRALLQKAHESLPSGGRVMIFNMMQDDDETGPLSAALGSPYFLTIATGEGMLYTAEEYATWARESGFEQVWSETLPRDHAVILAKKA